MIFTTRIAGIPCGIEITHAFRQPALGPGCDNRDDCDGYVELEWEVVDRRGRAAPWLDAKLTDRERRRIDKEAIEFLESDDD
jgi:hypothetical protein